MQLHRRTVLITGASRGIGAASARAFAAYPLNMALLGRDAAALQQLAAELQKHSGVQALPLVADVTDAQAVQDAVTKTAATFGGLDILINNAGVGMRSPIGDIDLQTARRLFDVNFWGVVQVTQAVLPIMRRQHDGLIINISSIIGRRAMPAAGMYCASKFALNALSEAMRVELKPHNIRVVNFYPGVTATAFSQNELTGDARGHHRNRMPRTPADKVGRAIVRAARREPRDAYATWFDRVLVWGALAAPWLVDWFLMRFYQPAGSESAT